MKGVEYENCKTFLKFKIHWEIKKLHKVLLFKRVTMFWKFLKDAKCAFDLQKHLRKERRNGATGKKFEKEEQTIFNSYFIINNNYFINHKSKCKQF